MIRFTKVVLVGLFLAGAAIGEGCAAHAEKYVFAIEKTRTYHRADCSLVHMAKTTKMTLSEAKTEGLKPCPLCKPDQE